MAGKELDRAAAIEATYEVLSKLIAVKSRREGLSLLPQYLSLKHYFAMPPRFGVKLRSIDPRERVHRLDFAALGSVKSGTTTVTNYLIQHPCVLFPFTKEPPGPYPSFVVRGDQAQKNLFHATLGEKEAIERRHGTALTGYYIPLLTDRWLLRNLADHNPALKIVLLLRNPIDRAYSHWKWDRGLLTTRRRDHFLAGVLPESFDELAQIEIEALRSGGPGFPSVTGGGVGYIQQGIYYPIVKQYLDRFGAQNVMVVRVEDLRDGLHKVQEIYRFLGLPEFEPRPLGKKAQLELEALSGKTWPPIEAQTRTKLNAYLEPLNSKLYELVGRDFEWS